MAKTLEFNDSARRALERGVDALANAVKVTLGPRGRNVVIDKKWGAPTITNDGVSIAKEIELEDPYEKIGAELVKEVAKKTDDVAALGSQRHLYGVGEAVQAPLETTTGLFVIRNCLGHCEVFLRIGDGTRMWSGSVPATDGCGCAPHVRPRASPARPSTHRSRVPTAFLALDHGECKVVHRGRRPSRKTSVRRSAASRR